MWVILSCLIWSGTAYGGEAAVVGIDALALSHRQLTPHAQGLVVEWASFHQAELGEAWNRAKHLESTGKICSAGVSLL